MMEQVFTKPLKLEVASKMLNKLVVEEINNLQRANEIRAEIDKLNEELNRLASRGNEIKCERAVINSYMDMENGVGSVSEEYEKHTVETADATYSYERRVKGRFDESYNVDGDYNRSKAVTKSNYKEFDNSIRQIFEQYDRPMRLQEIIAELDNHGFKWSRYNSAAAFISNWESLIKVGFGKYNLIDRI